MTVLDQIHRDHHNMSKVLKLIEHEVEALSSKERRDYLMLMYAMEYMINYTDRVHHAKENIMFRLLKARDPESVALVDDITREHDDIFSSGAAFHQMVQTLQGGGFVLRDEIVDKGRKYVALTREHMGKEERGLLKRAASVFDDAELQAITGEIENARDPLFEGEVEAEFAHLYQHIMDHYSDDFAAATNRV